MKNEIFIREEQRMNEKNKFHILVVDDNAVLLRNVKNILEEEYSVSVAASGLQAIMSMQKKKPDLILLDYEMPGMDGEDMINKIQSEPQWRDIPVIFLTSVADKDIVLNLLSYRPAGYLLKPADRTKLLGLVKKHLEV